MKYEVGQGRTHYRTANGKPGEICAVGFAVRKSEMTLYGLTCFPGAEELLAKLGTKKPGKGCLYVRKLSEVDAKVLERVVAAAFRARDGAAV